VECGVRSVANHTRQGLFLPTNITNAGLQLNALHDNAQQFLCMAVCSVHGSSCAWQHANDAIPQFPVSVAKAVYWSRQSAPYVDTV
jgi:hypothetical protein